ncbi:TPA: 16S rRNA (adenine(1518)-N(6)/adenine(1519)-N(6))-dimethyltransferase RsmA [Clostridium botulinum]|uniref:16S rRNA (adenine(1518)-N(6)/adenine(1519)-N(6))- dimethyltransferase RsmA n=1 Tax=Clostridium botulinum TaxID=1491 RepID=UPI0015E78900|nr:16S rRNA (adenine(1518)-N(6)/adenine(1519)-N(6))-dimethyltransferase RsmA [Clostridium botulinum]HDK7139178.1 16S rRNA (adenine(1518)-N(6)/adenine(1519)-N(6))-dimethyltransferase RsmA [Clostridium botulinum]HDK7142799.1 16S rRNA (adenine(1518)-N(6)/adenine(1519)-N(6))-dimethyltransferase RsmA [Clostridium botulinum]HDK7145593.1 16S rRNA (adenine(1518)-N(6)/adenine(1519)-N(6))-dimethyltransferase RsmA [Clostridium botulinum]HDK7149244.1 16S rRNA (adenine(1518)-N(6)/adenine(1519)-N(6))-dimethy
MNTKEIVNKYEFKFNKNLGQNFLIDESVLEDIIEGAEINKEDTVIEIGPGVGTLTKELLERAKEVYSIELDGDLIPILQEELKEYNNFTLIHKDALKIDFNELMEDKDSIKLVANLPYYVTTPIISRLLTEKSNFKSLTIMIQKEVAERINAEPNCKEYGSLTVLVQYYCNTKIIRKVSPNSFIPRPKVDSIVIKLDRLSEPRVRVKSQKLFFNVVRSSFNMRRKTLWNSLKSLNIDKESMENAFERAGIDPKRRGETLSIEEFGKLSDCIYDIL